MGTVWLARRSDGRYEGRVAVKLLNAALMGQPTEQRFVREGSVLAKLRHPNIANLIDAGVAPSGQPYLVLEYVAGEHIDSYAERQNLGVEARLRLFLDVLTAVAHAHSHLIVHRDIKPSNILVTSDGVVKLLDFGIAALLGTGDTGLTREVDPGLTPEYAAPEQLLKQPVTTATDVYALGRVLFMLLAGRHPLQPAGRSFAELARATLDNDAPRPSELAADAALGHALKGDLDNIILKALKKNPEERYHTAEALAQDLRSFLACKPVSARPDSVAYRAGKFVRRHRAPVALAAFAVLALVAGLTGTLIESRRATAHARLAEVERDRADRAAADATVQRDVARRQLARAEAINDLNSFLLADAAAVGKSFTARDLLTRAEQIVARQVNDPDGTRLESGIAIGRLYGTLGETGDANRVLERAYEQSRAATDPSLRAKASCELSRAVVRTGDVARARQLLDQGLRELPDESQFKLTRVLCYICGVGLENWAGDGEKAIVYARAAESLAAESGASSSLLQLRIAMDLADSYRVAGRYSEADGLFSDAYDRLVALGRDETERAGILLNNWGLVLGSLGRPRESEQMLRRVAQISSAKGSDALVEPILWANLARALFDLGRYSEGLELATRAYTEALAEGDTLAADQALLLRARLHLAKGDIERGAALLDPGGIALSENVSAYPPRIPGRRDRSHPDSREPRRFSGSRLARGSRHPAGRGRYPAPLVFAPAVQSPRRDPREDAGGLRRRGRMPNDPSPWRASVFLPTATRRGSGSHISRWGRPTRVKADGPKPARPLPRLSSTWRRLPAPITLRPAGPGYCSTGPVSPIWAWDSITPKYGPLCRLDRNFRSGWRLSPRASVISY